MSVDEGDLHFGWHRYFLNKIKPKEHLRINTIQEERAYYQEAERAIEREQKRHRELLQYNDDRDQSDEYENNGVSDYDFESKLWDYTGDIPIKRFWWDTGIQYIDKTDGITFWKYEEDFDIDEDWYTKTPEDFNKIQRLLSPFAKQRQYGRVFFSTETSYISKDKVLPISKLFKVAGYYKINDEKHIVERSEFQRLPRACIYNPPLRGVTTYNSEKFTYKHTGTGILKTLNPEGHRYAFILRAVNSIKTDFITNTSSCRYNYTQVSAIGVLFEQVRAHHLDIESWANDFSRGQYTYQERQQIVHWNWLSECTKADSSRQDHFIHEAICRKVSNSIKVRRVQKIWRQGSRRFSTTGKLVFRVQSKWRRLKLQLLGTKYTVKGLIGRNTNQN